MGGRGSSGKSSKSLTAHPVKITEEDWYDWQVDPEAFQEALNEGIVPKYGAEGRRLSEEERQRIFDVAHQMQKDADKKLNASIKEVYRGESYPSRAAAEEVFRTGSTYTTKKLTSVTTDRGVAQEYAAMGSGGGVKVVHVMTSIKGTRGLKVPNSSEIVSPKELKYKVTGTSWDGKTNTLRVYMFRNSR